MTDDEVLAEVRRIRLAYAEQFNFDVHAIGRHLREQEQLSRLSGRTVVRLPPRRIVPPEDDGTTEGSDPVQPGQEEPTPASLES